MLAIVCAIGLALAGCGSSKEKRLASYEPESFASTGTHSHNYAASEAQTCEAARRALLSQGYQVKDATAQQVSGVKSFQPENEVHMEVSLRVVCAKDARAAAPSASTDAGKATTAFVSALQDRYALKKTSNSAGVGVGLLGSISLPYSSSDDTMVKVASQTVTDERFYERFYALVDRYLVSQGPDPEPPPKESAADKPDAAKPDAAKPDAAKAADAAKKD
ncbi:hypothetical protein SAMN05444747_112110 [Variovorax sp. OV329]|nr:hypothetical protein SAMN05444747_112110 [Variovorax sp. OV329]